MSVDPKGADLSKPDIVTNSEAAKSFTLWRLYCLFAGHNTYIDGHEWLVHCRRCGRDVLTAYWWQRIPSQLAAFLVTCANKLIHEKESNGWFHGYARISNIDYIAKSHLQSLVNQGDDMLLSKYLSDEGWIKLSDLKHEDGTPYTLQEQSALISKSLTFEATKQEQEELNND